MSQTPPPTGYMNRKIAESVQEAVANRSMDHIKTIVKAAIQRYIESFMNTQGGNRKIFEVLTKLGLQYITDKSFDQASDPTLRKTQLARLFEQVRRELPAILIVDSEFEYIQSNFTGIDRAYIQNNFWYGTVQVVRRLKISIVVGTRDQTSTDFLHGLLSILFGELLFISHGTRMTGNTNLGESWVIGMGNPVLGNITQARVNEDPKDTIWSFVIDLPNVLYEDHVTIKQPIDVLEQPPGPGVVNGFANVTPIIYAPNTIPINQSVKLLFQYFQPLQHSVIIDNPNIATYNPTTQEFSPRRLGTCNIQVVIGPLATRVVQNQPFNQQTGTVTEVVAQKQITITAR
jgi:hypothetical protein